MGNRIIHDSNDLAMWHLLDAGPTFRNALGNTAYDLTGSGTFTAQEQGLFFGTGGAVTFTGADSTTPRNYIAGANTLMPTGPMSIAFWVYVPINHTPFSYPMFFLNKQKTVNTWSNITSLEVIGFQIISGSSLGEWAVTFNSSAKVISMDRSMPIAFNRWTMLSLAYDGVNNASVYLNGSLVGQSTTIGTLVWDVSTPGPWFTGAIPNTSANPSEGLFSICQVRISNVVRPQSYFQAMYTGGAIIGTPSKTHSYRLIAWDSVTFRGVPWTSIHPDMTDAPASPDGNALTTPPVILKEFFQ